MLPLFLPFLLLSAPPTPEEQLIKHLTSPPPAEAFRRGPASPVLAGARIRLASLVDDTKIWHLAFAPAFEGNQIEAVLTESWHKDPDPQGTLEPPRTFKLERRRDACETTLLEGPAVGLAKVSLKVIDRRTNVCLRKEPNAIQITVVVRGPKQLTLNQL